MLWLDKGDTSILIFHLPRAGPFANLPIEPHAPLQDRQVVVAILGTELL